MGPDPDGYGWQGMWSREKGTPIALSLELLSMTYIIYNEKNIFNRKLMFPLYIFVLLCKAPELNTFHPPIHNLLTSCISSDWSSLFSFSQNALIPSASIVETSPSKLRINSYYFLTLNYPLKPKHSSRVPIEPLLTLSTSLSFLLRIRNSNRKKKLNLPSNPVFLLISLDIRII